MRSSERSRGIKRMAWRSLIGVMLVGTGSAQAATGLCERIVVTGNPDYPPILWADPENADRLVGAAVELLESALAHTEVKVEFINAGSLTNAQDEVRSGRMDMLASAFLTPERLGYMDYVYPAYVEVPSVIFVRRGQSFPYNGWDDLRGRNGSTLANNSFGAAFDTYAKDHLTLERTNSIDQSFRRLLGGQADYVVYERFQGLALAEQQGFAEEIDILEGSLINERVHFTLSHNSACNSAALRSALAIGMHRMAGAGEPRRLLEKYRERWAGQFLKSSTEGEIEPEIVE